MTTFHLWSGQNPRSHSGCLTSLQHLHAIPQKVCQLYHDRNGHQRSVFPSRLHRTAGGKGLLTQELHFLAPCHSSDYFSSCDTSGRDLCYREAHGEACVPSLCSRSPSACWVKKILQRFLQTQGLAEPQDWRILGPWVTACRRAIALLAHLFGLYVKTHQVWGIICYRSWHYFN